jgi:hypothetical protein
MPFDDTLAALVAATAEARAPYRSAVGSALDHVRAYLNAHRSRADVPHWQAAGAELGAFASGRVSAERFATLFAASESLAPDAEQAIERAVYVLADLLERGDDLFFCDVPPGGDFVAAVRESLARIGRAFGAAMLVQSVKVGTYAPDTHDELLRGLDFARWNRAERSIAPPLVVAVDGADLRAGALAEFLDGRMRLHLVVRGASAPAPLARLVTPGVLVQQAATIDELVRALAFEGPAVTALVPEGAARFIHDPARGRTPAERITITSRPAEPKTRAVGASSAWQQAEELSQLVALATVVAPAIPSPAPSTVSESRVASSSNETTAEALTHWLLCQAGLLEREALA